MKIQREILSGIYDLPSFPAVATRLIALLQNSDTNIQEIVRIIELDPALTARLLRAANSAYWGLPVRVYHAREAILRLGYDRTAQLVIAMTMGPIMNIEVSGYLLGYRDLWQHSVATAVAAECLAIRVKSQNASEAFTAGLLHDVGKLVMNRFVADNHRKLDELTNTSGQSYAEAETQEFSINHAEVGAEILEYWMLPSSIVNAVRYHHEPQRSYPDGLLLVEIVNVANAMVLMAGIGVGRDGLRFRVDKPSIERFNLSPRAVAEMMSQVASRLEAAKELIDLE